MPSRTRSQSVMPITARSWARPTPTATICGQAGSATTAAGAGPSSTTPRKGMTGPRIRSDSNAPASRGRSIRTSAWGWTPPGSGAGPTIPISATTATIPFSISTSTRMRDRANPCTKRRERGPTSPSPARCSTFSATMCAATGCRRFRGSPPRKRFQSMGTGRRITAPGTRHRCWMR